ncbi:MAG: Rpn family recombination-promoting nuclease/putative transposase, partial [Acetatifactor sp.]|nr:Rpn family recombination-promoting nuclease/putative transposase [Acetatifactor sp.]
TSFKLRSKKGKVFSDLLEIHVIELRKKGYGMSAVDEWIQLFNAESLEDLDAIKTDNPGILRAMEMIREMSLSKNMRAIIQDNRKRRRDRNAEDAYVFDRGVERGIEQGMERGKLSAKADCLIRVLASKGEVSPELTVLIRNMKDEKQLDKLFSEAVVAESVEDFEKIL